MNNVEFLTENENISRENSVNILIRDFKRFFVSPGDIYWVRKTGGKVCLYRAGDLVDAHHVSKFEKVSQLRKRASPYFRQANRGHLEPSR